MVRRRTVCQALAALAVAIPLSCGGCAQDEAKYSMVEQERVVKAPRPSTEATDAAEEQAEMRRAPLVSASHIARLGDIERRYQGIVAAGGWGRIPAKSEDGRNQLQDVERLVRARLAAEGYEISNASFEALVAALKRFQSDHGVRSTGYLDGRTIHALNVSAENRLTQIRKSVVRLRDAAGAITRHQQYILVNIPEFRLEVVEGPTVVARHRVIVGRAERPTPSLSASIRNINLHPTWHVPESIARQDLLPRISSDPGYLSREHFRVTGGRRGEAIDVSQVAVLTKETKLHFQQEPGPWNALGLIRLDMPNSHNVYLHDTPMKDLFKRHDRAFSAGCIRVEDVRQLAGWLLRDVPGWDSARFDSALNAGHPVDIPLPKPIPVLFVYATASASETGSAAFHGDIYGRDDGDVSNATAKSPNAGYGLSP